MFTVVLYVIGRRVSAVERAAERARTEARALERLAREQLALRDLANTPLQTLEIVVELLRRQHPEARELSDRMERSLVRLRELSRAISVHPGVRWGPREESFDPLAVLELRPP